MKNNIVFLILVILFCFVGFVVNFKNDNVPLGKKRSLLSVLHDIPRWELVNVIPMDAKIKNSLELDDYLFQDYSNGTHLITLYVGYYNSAKKIGAAHDPMVCFPGQGWTINKTENGIARIINSNIDEFSYATIKAQMGDRTQYILYWFQAFDEPSSNTLSQKIKLLKKNIQGKGQDNAFVRISTPCAEKDGVECKRILLNFVNDFYPVFFKYITSD